MKPALAFPFNDPDGTMFHHLQIILPDLKEHFEREPSGPRFLNRSSMFAPRRGRSSAPPGNQGLRGPRGLSSPEGGSAPGSP